MSHLLSLLLADINTLRESTYEQFTSASMFDPVHVFRDNTCEQDRCSWIGGLEVDFLHCSVVSFLGEVEVYSSVRKHLDEAGLRDGAA